MPVQYKDHKTYQELDHLRPREGPIGPRLGALSLVSRSHPEFLDSGAPSQLRRGQGFVLFQRRSVRRTCARHWRFGLSA
eukprot:9469493-Pyramimonas_sp.AAC.1